MQKKFISFLCFTLMLLNLCAVSAFAETALVVTVGKAEVSKGDTIEIPVTLSGNTGFADMGIEIGYNSDVMTLTKVTSNSSVGGTFTPAQNYTVNPFNMGWSNTANITYNGVLATLTFKIADNAASGVYPVTVDYYKGRNGNYTDGDDVNYNENLDALGLQYVNGSITVKSGGGSSGGSMVVSGISFTVKLAGDTSVGNVYAAIYDASGRLKNLKQYPAADSVKIEFDAGVTGAYVKIMWWDNNMKPMCEAQTIPLQ